jgi:hypothetical protein
VPSCSTCGTVPPRSTAPRGSARRPGRSEGPPGSPAEAAAANWRPTIAGCYSISLHTSTAAAHCIAYAHSWFDKLLQTLYTCNFRYNSSNSKHLMRESTRAQRPVQRGRQGGAVQCKTELQRRPQGAAPQGCCLDCWCGGAGINGAAAAFKQLLRGGEFYTQGKRHKQQHGISSLQLLRTWLFW